MTPEIFATAGSLFVPLAFWHFVTEWCTQTERMSGQMSTKVKPLFLHCFFYMLAFLPLLWLYGLSWPQMLATSLIMFGGHALGAQGLPVFLWAKYIHRMYFTIRLKEEPKRVQRPKDMFRRGTLPPLSFYFKPGLTMAVGHLWHMALLWVPVAFALSNSQLGA